MSKLGFPCLDACQNRDLDPNNPWCCCWFPIKPSLKWVTLRRFSPKAEARPSADPCRARKVGLPAPEAATRFGPRNRERHRSLASCWMGSELRNLGLLLSSLRLGADPPNSLKHAQWSSFGGKRSKWFIHLAEMLGG